MIMDDDGFQPRIFSATIDENFCTVRIPDCPICLSATSPRNTLVTPAGKLLAFQENDLGQGTALAVSLPFRISPGFSR